MRPSLVLAISYVIGAIPFSGLVARMVRGVDLRDVGTRTVSGTGLYRVAGLRPLLLGGVLDLAKGTVGPLLAGGNRPWLRVVSGSATVAGHNWSVFLGGAGGRGISPAMGAMLVGAPEGSALMLMGLAVGKAFRATSLVAFGACVALVPVLARTRGRRGAATAVSLVIPILVKRAIGNEPPPDGAAPSVWVSRLLFDQDTPQWPRWFVFGEVVEAEA